MSDKLYAERSTSRQGEVYTDHVMAMTEEKLHSKSDIAAELAHRDIKIHELQKELAEVKAERDELQKKWDSIDDYASMMIDRTNKRTPFPTN